MIGSLRILECAFLKLCITLEILLGEEKNPISREQQKNMEGVLKQAVLSFCESDATTYVEQQ